jgi:ABC-2 type transport system ATP-binding protein
MADSQRGASERGSIAGVSGSDGSRERIVEAAGLTKTFSDFWMRATARAVDGIDFHIDRHEIFGLLGPNGSGKSTTIKMILGLLHKSHGRLVVFGRDPADVAVKRKIGYLPEETYLYRFLNPTETLDYYGKLFGLDRRTRNRRTAELLDMVGLTQVAHRASGEFSKGMARRLGLAQALVNDPELLILDEPTSGLDPIGTKQVKDLILELGRRGKTILLTSHLLADVEDVCDRMVILYGGKIRAAGTSAELLADSRHTLIRAPRLDDSTIRAVDERARAEQLATSGAQSGGRIASFLQAGGSVGTDARAVDAAEARVLVDDLVKGAAEITKPSSSAATMLTAGTAPAQAKGVDASMLDKLVEPAKNVATPAAPPTASPNPSRPDLDRGVIDSLLGDSSKRDGGSGAEGRG